MCRPSESASARMQILPYRSWLMSAAPGSTPIATAILCTSWLASTCAAIDFPSVQNLAAQRQDGLEFLVAGLLGLPPAESPSTRNSSARDRGPGPRSQPACRAVRGPCVMRLADDCFSGLQAARWRVRSPVARLRAQLGVLVEPQAETRRAPRLRRTRGLARRQPLLGLAAELRVGHLHRQHERDALPHVFRGQLHTARQQIAELAELAQRIGAGPCASR
jgi:hypothetical protein